MLVLVGYLVSYFHGLTDLQGKQGTFFAYVDISARIPEIFQLHFIAFRIGRGENGAQLVASVLSEPLKVWCLNEFPGISDLTT